MKRTFDVDDELFRAATAACGAAADTDTVRLELDALARHAACEHLRPKTSP